MYFCYSSVQSSKRRLSPERGHRDEKRQKRDEEASDRQRKEEVEEEDEEERLAEEKLKQLQELAEKSMAERSTQPSSSSLSSKGCLKSSWQQIGNLLLYTAAGVKGSNKVGKNSFIYLIQCNLIISNKLAGLMDYNNDYII